MASEDKKFLENRILAIKNHEVALISAIKVAVVK